MKAGKESAQGIPEYAYFEMSQREKLHNYWKLTKPLSVFLVQPLDIELG